MNSLRPFITLSILFVLTACLDTDKRTTALELAKNSIIVDGHIDVPYRVLREWEDVTKATTGGDFDYPRAIKGGLNAPFMSIYTPASLAAEGKSKERADELITLVEKIVSLAPDKYAIATSPSQIREQFKQGLISLPLGMENGSPIEGKIENLAYFFNKGIRYITLAHSLSNQISDSSYDSNKAHDGLSGFGEEVVREMNRLGIIIDISHVSDAAFWDVMDITKVPVIASHSSARHFTPGFERNMDDDMIVRLAENGGIIMINYGSAFVTEEANQYNTKRSDAWEKFLSPEDGTPIDMYNPELRNDRDAFNKQYAELNPYPFATLEQTLDHFDHVVKLTGSVDFVGIGSDYDGVGNTLPIGLKDVSSYPNLINGLMQRGYSNDDIKKILGENLLRVWGEIENGAE
ncbi:MAG: membrane dipeptidase [Woeseiaceae bacterium]|jgi:membrane dipeptidase|nr:membrane dipeptidase [Woeseiaceae bacterium]